MFSIKPYVKLYSIPIALVIIAGMFFFGAGRDNDESVTVAEVQQATVTQAKVVNAVESVTPNAGPRLEKIISLEEIISKAQEITDPEIKIVIVSLVSSKTTGDFITSLRSQAIRWLYTPPESRTRTNPLSPKQLAWASYVINPSTAPYPYAIKELYPDGKPAK